MDFLRGGFHNIRLDIVGFLAFLGEGLVLVHYQVSALSNFTYLPRLIPAPTALIRTTRPTELPTAKGKVSGVYSGNYRGHVQQVAHILLNDKSMDPFTVRCVQIGINESGSQSKGKTGGSKGKELHMTGKEKSQKRLEPKMKTLGPLTAAACLGCLVAVTNMVLAIVYHDGMALLATIFLSILSTVVGICNKSSLKLRERIEKAEVPPGDVVIELPNGAFLVVRCHEKIARQLFFAPEDIKYNIESPFMYRFLSLSGTLLLMGGIITLANSKTELQLSFAASYIIMNAVYWIVAALPARAHWDLSIFDVTEQPVKDNEGNVSQPSRKTWLQRTFRSFGNLGFTTGANDEEGTSAPKSNYTEALWKACFISGKTRWAILSNAAPRTEVWDEWLAEVDKQIAEHREQNNRKAAKADRAGVTSDEAEHTWVLPSWAAKQRWNDIHKEIEKKEQGKTAPTAQQASAVHTQVPQRTLQLPALPALRSRPVSSDNLTST